MKEIKEWHCFFIIHVEHYFHPKFLKMMYANSIPDIALKLCSKFLGFIKFLVDNLVPLCHDLNLIYAL
jgi:hypothetical protein